MKTVIFNGKQTAICQGLARDAELLDQRGEMTVSQAILASHLKPVLLYLRDQKADPSAVLSAAGLDARQFNSPSQRLDHQKIHDVFETAMAVTGDAHLGLHIGEYYSVDSLADAYLARESASIGEIAFLLGFSDPSTFHRAFERMTGVTPAQYRAGNRGPEFNSPP